MLPHQSYQQKKTCPGAPVRSGRHTTFEGLLPRPLNLNVMEYPGSPRKPEGFLTLPDDYQGHELFPGKFMITRKNCPGAPMKKSRSAHLLEGVQGQELFP